MHDNAVWWTYCAFGIRHDGCQQCCTQVDKELCIGGLTAMLNLEKLSLAPPTLHEGAAATAHTFTLANKTMLLVGRRVRASLVASHGNSQVYWLASGQ